MEESPRVVIGAWPAEITPDDKLQDGPDGKPFELPDVALLVWIDWHPDHRFAHPTHYLAICPDGVRSEKGQWWPVLNGKRIICGNQNSIGMVSPFRIASATSPADRVEVFLCHTVLTPEDSLQDGKSGSKIKLTGNTFLIWVDFDPDAKFSHRTAYILVSADNTVRVEQGQWWPSLNGKCILYPSRNTCAVILPFSLR